MVKSAVLLKGPGGRAMKVEVVEKETPAPGPGDLVVEMKACGLCGTDLEKIRCEYTASLPIIGHEAVGTVSAVGDEVTEFKEGDRVFPHHHVPCYRCHYCRSGSETMCEHYRGSNLAPGGFSEFFSVPKWNVDRGGVLKIPRVMDYEVASLIEPLACCIRAMHRSQVRQGETVLVVGAGPVGMMNAMLLKGEGAEVIVSDVVDFRLDLASELQVGETINAARRNVPSAVRKETEGRGADIALVASGNKEAILQGLNSIRRGGRVCLFGIPLKDSVLDYDISALYNSEQSVVSSYGAVESDTKEALTVLSGRGDEFRKLITHRFPLARFAEAVDLAGKRDAMKVIITP